MSKEASSKAVRVDTASIPRFSCGTLMCTRIYSLPKSSPRGIIVYIHGGAFASGDERSDEDVCRAMAGNLQAPFVVICPDFRQGGDYPWASGCTLDDLAETIHHARKHFGGGMLPLGVSGGSSGGYLALLIAVQAAGGKSRFGDIAFVVAMCPVVHPGLRAEYLDACIQSQSHGVAWVCDAQRREANIEGSNDDIGDEPAVHTSSAANLVLTRQEAFFEGNRATMHMAGAELETKAPDSATLLIFAEHDKNVPLPVSARLRRAWANSETVVLKDVGHEICSSDMPEEAKTRISGFLQRVLYSRQFAEATTPREFSTQGVHEFSRQGVCCMSRKLLLPTVCCKEPLMSDCFKHRTK